MEKENFKRAIEIDKSIDALNRLHSIMNVPYPTFIDNNGNEVCLVEVDGYTCATIKSAVVKVISDRRKELGEEFRNL